MKDKTWSVYALMDPRDRRPFYVGMSVDPRGRFKLHLWRSDNAGVREHVGFLADVGLRPYLEIVSTHPTRALALAHEREAIETTPRLVNAAIFLKKQKMRRANRVQLNPMKWGQHEHDRHGTNIPGRA